MIHSIDARTEYAERARANTSASATHRARAQYVALGALTQVAGMSTAKARAVVARYPTLVALVRAYDAAADDERRAYLLADTVELVDAPVLKSTGQRPRIGDALSVAVAVAFLGIDATRYSPRTAAKRRRQAATNDAAAAASSSSSAAV